MRMLRTIAAAVFTVGTLLVLAPADGWAVSAKVAKTCTTLASLQGDLQAVGSAAFDGSAWADVGAAFRTASKSAPKQVKAALAKMGKTYESVGEFETEREAEAALGSATQALQKSFAKFESYYENNCSSGGSTGAGSSGAGGGTLTLGDETIGFDTVRCYLEEQDSAGGGGKILLTGQGVGTNAAGDEVRLDFTRYDEDSMFHGDDVSVDIGEPATPDFQYGSDLEFGAVSRSGSTLSASGIELFEGNDDGSVTTVTASFELNC